MISFVIFKILQITTCNSKLYLYIYTGKETTGFTPEKRAANGNCQYEIKNDSSYFM